MKSFFKIAIIFLVLAMHSFVLAASPTLYVVTRSTKVFRLGKSEFPSVGLFSTNDQGQHWKHYGWYYTKCFSATTTMIDGQRVYYLACGNGVQKSPDGGRHWIITTGWQMTEVLRVAVDPQDKQTVYAATAYGIFKTQDGGKTWVEKNRGLTSTFTETIVIDRSDHDRLFCATESGVHRSDDGGEHWQPVALLGFGIRTLVQHPTNPDIFAAGTEDDGVFISKDHGQTWQPKNNGLTHKTIYALSFSPHDERTIYAGTFGGGIFKSDDAGNVWKAINNGLRILDIHALAIDPTDGRTVYAGTLNDGVWKSKNGGENWHFIGLETSQVWDMFFE